ncbi:MAG TPA: glycosyltransferase family 4 protein [Roseiflexaceae bacterium]|nr:glycosyltransferase family 4 protein [Roseiflexaceae bacterium]
MRIAFLDSWFQNILDGSGTAAGIGGLQRALIAKGHHVARVAPPVGWPQTITARRLLFNLHLPLLLRSLRYDLIIGHDIDGVLWSRRRNGSDTPYLVGIHGVIAEEMQHERGRVHWLFQALAQLEGHNARNADAVLATSNYCRLAIERHYHVPSERLRVVPLGIDLPRWRTLATAQGERDGATILCVARQYPRKHVADLLRAIPAVRKAIPNARTIIVGDGPEHAALRALAAELNLGDAALLTGALPDEQLRAMYRRADVFCLPSVQEGFGIVFLEAMASGLPVVATRSAAMPEVIPHGEAGLLVPPGDSAALAEALIALLGSPARRAAFAEYGRSYVERFDWPVVAERFLDTVRPFVRPALSPA